MTCRNIIEVYDITPKRRGVIKRSVKKTPAPLERESGVKWTRKRRKWWRRRRGRNGMRPGQAPCLAPWPPPISARQ